MVAEIPCSTIVSRVAATEHSPRREPWGPNLSKPASPSRGDTPVPISAAVRQAFGQLSLCSLPFIPSENSATERLNDVHDLFPHILAVPAAWRYTCGHDEPFGLRQPTAGDYVDPCCVSRKGRLLLIGEKLLPRWIQTGRVASCKVGSHVSHYIVIDNTLGRNAVDIYVPTTNQTAIR